MGLLLLENQIRFQCDVHFMPEFFINNTYQPLIWLFLMCAIKIVSDHHLSYTNNPTSTHINEDLD